MGCGASTEGNKDKARNDEIENQLKRDEFARRCEVKLLLLGPGDSGKSTVLKQMKLIYQRGFSRDEREFLKKVIHSSAVQSMRSILEAMESFELSFHNQCVESHAQTVLMQQARMANDGLLPPKMSAAIAALWKDRGVQECFERLREHELDDSASHYFDAINRIAAPEYLPNDEDVLRSRIKSTGITETTFTVQCLTYRVLDVGGQRSERKKWIHCFENVTAVLFVVAISEYDQKLFENGTVNRLQEALTLFDSICNSEWFIKTSIILFLNKIDRFREKLLLSPLRAYFPEYHGGPDYASACDYIRTQFMSLNHADTKRIYTYFTCATDTTHISFVISAVNALFKRISGAADLYNHNRLHSCTHVVWHTKHWWSSLEAYVLARVGDWATQPIQRCFRKGGETGIVVEKKRSGQVGVDVEVHQVGAGGCIEADGAVKKSLIQYALSEDVL